MRRATIVAAQTAKSRIPEKDQVKLRGEVEAPFRSFRLVIFGFFVVSAGIGTLLATTQLIGDVIKSKSLTKDLQNVGIDVGAASLFGWLAWRDWQARNLQLARLTREETLGRLQVELANRKRLKLFDLRSFSRVVIAAGSPEQVEAAVKQAEPFRDELLARGILIVPLPIFKSSAEGAGPIDAPVSLESRQGDAEQKQAALKFKAKPLQADKWREWFSEQMKLANANPDRGLYVSLRLDGRVRASGAGSPPWPAFVAQLPPLTGDGAWTGFFDVFDGKM